MAKQPRTWLVSDTHFNHQFLIDGGHRPADYNEQIKKKWKQTILPQDTVFHLGDVILGRNGTLGDILNSLPGTKVLVRGNHDHASNGWYTRHGFAHVAHGILHGGVWLTHVPQTNLPDGAIMNVHGHLHNTNHHPGKYPDHCKLLALEYTDYYPVEFDKFTGMTATRKLLLGLT